MYLETREMVAGYGKKVVLKGVSLGLKKGEIVALLGHNGAGKSTTLQVVAGLRRAISGAIIFNGEDITNRDMAENVKNGITLVPQGRAFFDDLSVDENLKMAGFTLNSRSVIHERIDSVCDFFPILKQRHAQEAGTLSGGEQRMLSLGIALIMRPHVMLLDEPTLGLAPLLATELINKIAEISRDFMNSVLLVEENISRVFSISHRAYIMKEGQIVYHGTQKTLIEMSEEELWNLF